jgi:hypothetical protein
MLLTPSDRFDRASLTLYANGFAIAVADGDKKRDHAVVFSPFSSVQACRLHSTQADVMFQRICLFKVSIFHYGETHYFAAHVDDLDQSESSQSLADLETKRAGRANHALWFGMANKKSRPNPNEIERVRWVADISRAMRNFTRSLFPEFEFAVDPFPGKPSSRLLAGYVLLCEEDSVALVYLELSVYWSGRAPLRVYEDERCERKLMQILLDDRSSVSERAGVGCSCFAIEGHNFTVRSVAEKALWLRTLSNIKVKVRNNAENPSVADMKVYRDSIREYVRGIAKAESAECRPEEPWLPRRYSRHCSDQSHSDAMSREDSSCCTGIADEDIGEFVDFSMPRFMPSSVQVANDFTSVSPHLSEKPCSSEPEGEMQELTADLSEPRAEPEPHMPMPSDASPRLKRTSSPVLDLDLSNIKMLSEDEEDIVSEARSMIAYVQGIEESQNDDDDVSEDGKNECAVLSTKDDSDLSSEEWL